MDQLKRPPKVDFTKSTREIEEMIQKREYWLMQMREYSRKILDAFERGERSEE